MIGDRTSSMSHIPAKKAPHRLLPDARRVITKPYHPGEEIFPDGKSRVKLVIERILAIPDADVPVLLDRVMQMFSERHRRYERVLEESFDLVKHHLDDREELSRERRLLMGAYFTHEFSIESAALFNPSIVPAPDQSDVRDGELRFIMSLRAVGEGHISSIEFRTGVIDAHGGVRIDYPPPYTQTGARQTPQYDKAIFTAKLAEIGAEAEVVNRVLEPLPDEFSFEQLSESIATRERRQTRGAKDTVRMIHWLASSNYVVTFPEDTEIAERVIFPAGPTESRGMEDARFVQFVDDDGTVSYYATYTAFDDIDILPQSILTEDFCSFRIATLNGTCAQNKGMALFPRRIGGKFTMLSRNDGENLYIMTSDNARYWDHAEKLRGPTRPWEFIQIGNCGSPIETDAGWLVLIHGVGPMRRYTMGAMLLDLDDPTRVIGHLDEPILEPDDHEREGYVPNVLYSCGALVHEGNLVLPYGFSDYGIAVATMKLDDVLGAFG